MTQNLARDPFAPSARERTVMELGEKIYALEFLLAEARWWADTLDGEDDPNYVKWKVGYVPTWLRQLT